MNKHGEVGMYLHPFFISSLEVDLRLRPRYPCAKGPHTGSGLRTGLDNSENRNNWSVALLGTERSPWSDSPQPLHCANRDTSGQGMGRTVHNNFGCSLSGPHKVLCQSQYTHDRTTEVQCSRETTSVVICKEHGMTVLTSQWFRFASPIQTAVSGARRWFWHSN